MISTSTAGVSVVRRQQIRVGRLRSAAPITPAPALRQARRAAAAANVPSADPDASLGVGVELDRGVAFEVRFPSGATRRWVGGRETTVALAIDTRDVPRASSRRRARRCRRRLRVRSFGRARSRPPLAHFFEPPRETPFYKTAHWTSRASGSRGILRGLLQLRFTRRRASPASPRPRSGSRLRARRAASASSPRQCRGRPRGTADLRPRSPSGLLFARTPARRSSPRRWGTATRHSKASVLARTTASVLNADRAVRRGRRSIGPGSCVSSQNRSSHARGTLRTGTSSSVDSAREDVAALVGSAFWFRSVGGVLRVRRLVVVTQAHARRSRCLRDLAWRALCTCSRARASSTRDANVATIAAVAAFSRQRTAADGSGSFRRLAGGGATAGTRVDTLRSRVLVVVDPFVDQQVRVRGGVRPGAERPAVLALHDRLAERAAAQRGDLLVVEAPPRVARGFGHGFGFFVSESRRLRARASVARRALRPHERDVVPAGSVLPAVQQDGLQRVRTAGAAFRPGTPRPVVSRAGPPARGAPAGASTRWPSRASFGN